MSVVFGVEPPTVEEFEALPVFDTPGEAWDAGIRQPEAFRLAGWDYDRHVAAIARLNTPKAHRENLARLQRERREREEADARRAAEAEQRRRDAQVGSIERDGDVLTITDEAAGVRFTLTIDFADAWEAPDMPQLDRYRHLVAGRLGLVFKAGQGATRTEHWSRRLF